MRLNFPDLNLFDYQKAFIRSHIIVLVKTCFLFAILITTGCNGVVKEYGKLMEDPQSFARVDATFSNPMIAYSGDSLRNIAFPLGGIGTGNLLVGGRGNLIDHEIFGRANADEVPPSMTFFAIRIEGSDGHVQTRVLEGSLPDNYPNPFGVPRSQLGGIPRFSGCRFTPEFPFAHLQLQDRGIPVKVNATFWNPFIPLNTKDSSLPLVFFDWIIQNTGTDSLEINLMLSAGNPFTDYFETEGYSGKVKSIDKPEMKAVIYEAEMPVKGEFMIGSIDAGTRISSQWFRGRWWDNAEIAWKEFREKGFPSTRTEDYTFHSEDLDVASLTVPFKLAPGQQDTLRFMIAWRMPEQKGETNLNLGSGREGSPVIRNHYASWNQSVIAIADYVLINREKLWNKTRDFHRSLYSSTYPSYVLDAIGSNLAALNTNLIMRNDEGKVHAYEGLGNDFGCCPGNCTHVWNYAQSLAYLFPELEQEMRETNFLHDTRKSGFMSFRTVFPPGNYFMGAAAADGQLGTIMRVYREWKFSGDSEWLETLWPGIKRALEFTWKGTLDHAEFSWEKPYRIPWDPGKEGVIRTRQHNTYDIDFYGPNMYTGALYLGALRAASEMAVALGDHLKASEYSELAGVCEENYEELLWNGEYYIQKPEIYNGVNVPESYKLKDPDSDRVSLRYQYEGGCLSDQLLGQFLADLSGLGDLLDTLRIRRTLQSIYNYNFVESFNNFQNVQRIYAINDEAGLVLCSWPEGNRPAVPFVYAQEVWTGVEYQVASQLIKRGYLEEGLNLVKAVRNRYRGYNRNPMAEIESGRFYARSLSSWGLLLALSGQHYNGLAKSLSFFPVSDPRRFRTLWTSAHAWGIFEIMDRGIRLKVHYGELELNRLSIGYPGRVLIREVKPLPAEFHSEERNLQVFFKEGLKLKEGEELTLVLEAEEG